MPRKKKDPAGETLGGSNNRPEEDPKGTEEVSAERASVEEASISGSMDDLTDCVVNDPGLVDKLNALGFRSKNPKGMTYKEAIMCSQIANAVKGDLKSYRAVVEMMRPNKTPPLVSYLSGEKSALDFLEE